MKLSALIHKSALQYILERTKVKEILGPIDSNPDYTTKSIVMRILNDESYPIVVEALFSYKMVDNSEIKPPDVQVIINWFPNLEFSLNDVKVLNN